MAHFKPFTRAKSGKPCYRYSSYESWSDDSGRSYRRYRRRSGGHGGGLLGLDIL